MLKITTHLASVHVLVYLRTERLTGINVLWMSFIWNAKTRFSLTRRPWSRQVFLCTVKIRRVSVLLQVPANTGLFISPSGNSELDCATTKTDTAERSISIGTESLEVSFVLGALAYFQVPPLGGSRDEKWRSQCIRKRSVSWNLPKLSQLWLCNGGFGSCTTQNLIKF